MMPFSMNGECTTLFTFLLQSNERAEMAPSSTLLHSIDLLYLIMAKTRATIALKSQKQKDSADSQTLKKRRSTDARIIAPTLIIAETFT